MLRTFCLLAVGLSAAGLSIASAMAAPLMPVQRVEAPSIANLLTPVHGCHSNVSRDERGPGRPFHRHVYDRNTGNRCREVPVRGSGRYYDSGPRYYESQPRYYEPQPRYYEPPRRACFEECSYIGPIRQCRTVCR